MLNLPKGTTEREIRNMFVFSRGFLKCQIYDQSNNPKNKSDEGCLGAFVLFETPPDAAVAQERLDGFMFDANVPHMTVNCRMAMKNLNISRSEMETLETDNKRIRSYVAPPQMMPYGQVTGPGMGGVYDAMGGMPQQAAPQQTEQQLQWDMAQGGMGMGMGGAMAAHHQYGQQHPYGQQAVQGYGAAPPMGMHGHGYGGMQGQGQGHMGGQMRPQRSSSSSRGPAVVGSNNPPCNTLFCSNMEQVEDGEFTAYVSGFAGHAETKAMTDRRGQRVAFVAFTDEASAGEALAALTNYRGVRASYSKNPLNQYRS